MIDWQPIETAPRDGTIVRLKCEHRPEYGEHTMMWRKGKWGGRKFGVARAFSVWWDDSADKPTHWALPETPEEKR